MSYLVNQSVPYTALASTVGMPLDTFSYVWSFDDGGSGNTASVNHTWTSVGLHNATVTATDNTTGGTASTSKSINVIDPATFSWTNSTVGNASSTRFTQPRRPTVIGNDLIYTGDYYTGVSIYRYTYPNTWSVVATRSGTGVGTYGTSSTLLNDGRVLMVGGYYDSTAYGFFDPNTNTYTHSSKTSLYGKGSGSDGRSMLKDGRVLFTSTSSDSADTRCEIYDPVADTWTATGSRTISATGDGNGMFTLPSGDVIFIPNNKTTTEIWNHTTGVWSAGPTRPTFASGAIFCGQLYSGRVFIYSGLQLYTYTEGDSSFAAEGGTAPGTISISAFGVTSDQKIFVVGYNYYANKTYVYDTLSKVWSTINVLAPINGQFGFVEQLNNGRIVASDSSGAGATGKIWYSSVW